MIKKCADFEYDDNYSRQLYDDLTVKLNNRNYQRTFQACELYLKKNPITFKEKYLK
jgi:hypothetical protein